MESVGVSYDLFDGVAVSVGAVLFCEVVKGKSVDDLTGVAGLLVSRKAELL